MQRITLAGAFDLQVHLHVGYRPRPPRLSSPSADLAARCDATSACGTGSRRLLYCTYSVSRVVVLSGLTRTYQGKCLSLLSYFAREIPIAFDRPVPSSSLI